VDAVGGLDRRFPARRRGPAVVDHDQEGAAAWRRLGGWPVDRAGKRNDERGTNQKAEEKQPPRGSRRLFLLARNLEQQARRGQHLRTRARREDAHQPPDCRQSDECEKNRWIGESEGEATHAARPPTLALPAAWRSARRAWRASNGSDAGRSV